MRNNTWVHTRVKIPRLLFVLGLFLTQCSEAPDSTNYRSRGSSAATPGQLSAEEQNLILQASAQVASTFEGFSDHIAVEVDDLGDVQPALPGSGFSLE